MHEAPSRLHMPYLLAAGSCLVLAVMAVVGSSLFFPLFSLWLDLLLFAAALKVLQTANIKFERYHMAVMGIIWVLAVIYTFFALNSRNFIYYWDYSNYILLQYDTEEAFAGGAIAGFKYLFCSLVEDYTSFICLFTEFPFCFTSRTGDAYAASQVVSVFPSLLVLLSGVVIKIGDCLGAVNKKAFYLIALSWCVTFPYLRMSAMLSQPDWFGLIFAFMIFVLTIDYRFDKIEAVRCIEIFLATASIILTRRWYLYFVVGYYFSYALLVIISCVRRYRNDKKLSAARRIRNLVLFGVAAIIAMLICLWPVVAHMLAYSYSSHYAYYNVGGMALEIYQQCFRIGLLNFILIALGLVYARRMGKLYLPCFAACQLFVSMLLFTRIQNTGAHQMLLFLPGWLLLFIVGAAAIADTLTHHKVIKLIFWGFTVIYASFVRCSPLTIMATPEPVLNFLADNLSITEYFVNIDTQVYNRTDADKICEITDWIDANCDDGETVYMIPHDMLYNPDIFENCQLPNVRLSGKLCFGFSVLGTHNFPTGILDSKYVITADPFPQTYVNEGELSNKLNNLFIAERDKYFTYETSFDMGNGTVFTVWRRTVSADRAEAEYYLNAFADEDAQFPEMFSGVINAWLEQHGL